MKGLNRVNMRDVMKELDQLKKMHRVSNQTTGGQLSLNEEGTLSVYVYVNRINKSERRFFIAENVNEAFQQISDIEKEAYFVIDDMLIASDEIYLPTNIILAAGRETVKRFIDLANEDSITYLKAYIELFVETFKPATSAKSKLLHDLREEPVLIDLLDNYDTESLEYLVERYSNQEFFKPIRKDD